MTYLPLAQATLAANHPTLSIDTDIRVGDAPYGIEEAVVQREAALLVMATHGRSGAKRAILGSIAGKIVQNGGVPVVLMHPARAADEPGLPGGQAEVAPS